MKSQIKKAAAVTLAMTMCVPSLAFGADTSGSFNTSFDVYSPALTVSVPVNADIRINPIADSSSTGVKKFTVASNSIDIINASVDVEKDVAIPVVATIQASISSKADGVFTQYNTFTADNASTKKKVYLALSKAGTDAVIGVKDGGAAAFDSDKKLDLTQYTVTTPANYSSPAQSVPITAYGSLLSLDIAGPDTDDSTTGKTYSSDPTKVKPKVASFAVTGVANTNGDWKENDINVAIKYNVKASQALSITTPTVAGVNYTSGASATDLSITVSGIGEATVTAVALHNDEKGAYGDFAWGENDFEVDYTTTQGSAIIKISKDNAVLGILAGDDYKTKAQDMVIGLSDGRMVVTTLTVN